jgi:hypothetical protein
VGSKNPHTVYWSPLEEPDRFVCVAMSAIAARQIARALNFAPDCGPSMLASLPKVPKSDGAQ